MIDNKMMEVYAILLSVYMFMGWLAFEWAWKQLESVRNVNEERDSKFPAYRRWDAINWKKWRFYLGAMTLMPIRLILSVLVVIFCYVFVR